MASTNPEVQTALPASLVLRADWVARRPVVTPLSPSRVTRRATRVRGAPTERLARRGLAGATPQASRPHRAGEAVTAWTASTAPLGTAAAAAGPAAAKSELSSSTAPATGAVAEAGAAKAAAAGPADARGGGSFGVWLYASVLVVEKSTITAGDGGAGGRGGNGGPGGAGGAGGADNDYCFNEIGSGGAGGRGGNGGQGAGGGGGAGGPSIGIFKFGGAQTRLTLSETKVVAGTSGAGGATGAGGTPAPRAEAGIAAAVYSS